MTAAIRMHDVVEVGAALDGGGRTSSNPAHAGAVAEGLAQTQVILKIEPQHRLIKELIAVYVADRIGLAHAPGVIGIFAERNPEAPIGISVALDGKPCCFASIKLDAVPIVGRNEIFLQSRFALELLAFDQLIANFDRVPANILENDGCYWAYDHDKILFIDSPRYCELPPEQLVQSPVGTDTIFSQVNARPTALQIANAVRDAVLNEELTIFAELISLGLLSEQEADCLAVYFKQRAEILPELIDRIFFENLGA